MYDTIKKRRCQAMVGGQNIPGWFHGWGLAIIQFSGPEGNAIPVNYSVGLVEDNLGFIHKVDPADVKFIL